MVRLFGERLLSTLLFSDDILLCYIRSRYIFNETTVMIASQLALIYPDLSFLRHLLTTNRMKTVQRNSLILFVIVCLGVPLPRAESEPETLPPGYSVETIEIPKEITLEVGGLEFDSDGDLYLTTRYGEVWIYRDGEWTRFADGLQAALGVSIPGNGEKIYVAQKPELTELVDTDGDDRAEEYNTITDDWGYTGDYHEFAFGPVRDARGNFYVALNLAHLAPGVVPGVMSRSTRHRGTLVKITPDGELSTYAYGLRSPASMAMSPDQELFLIDSQGDWVATSALFNIKPGRFYGHPGSLVNYPGFEDKNIRGVDKSVFEQLRTRPNLWIPYRLANSPGSPAFDTKKVDFGPFDDQIFIGDQTNSNIMRIDLERVHGRHQGVVFNFIDHLQCGITRTIFGPDDNLWVGQTSRGWSSKGSKPYGLQRISYDGETPLYALETIRLRPNGFRIKFTQPINRTAAQQKDAYDLRYWNYHYHQEYGSDPINTTGVEIRSINVVDDRTVDLALKQLPAEKVYDIHVDVPSSKGQSLTNKTGYYTLNRKR